MAIGRPLNLTANVASKNISVLATAGQTSFTVTGGYRINEIAVYRNGTRLVDGRDFTATDGSIVTLVSAATIYDVIEYQIFDSFNVANAVGTSGDSTINGNLTATEYYGDGSNLTGITAGATLSAGSGAQRLVVTSLTSGTMTSAATDADLAWNSSTNTLSATNITGALTGDASGSSGSCTGNAAGLTGSPNITINNLVGVAATFSGVVTYEDVTNVDSLGIITARSGIEFGAAGVGGTITAVGNAEFAGICTVSTLKVGTAATINSSGLDVVGIASVGVAITMYGSSGIVSATSFYGDGQYLDNVSATGGGETDITSCLFI